MRYWDDFQSKYGFGDGSDVPPDAPAVRQVYVEEINKRATALKSTYRVVAWDRPGCHNPFFILKVPLEVYNCFDQRWIATGLYDPGTLRDWDVSKTDEALEQAIADVGEAGVEYWVDCKVTIRRPRKCKIH